MIHRGISSYPGHDVSDTTIVQAARVIAEQAPAPPSSLDSKLRGDVETVILKALAKERERRYQSAGELAADIRRFLNREPIAARTVSTWRRITHWIARHPIATTSATSVTILTIGIAMTFVSIWFLRSRPHRIVRSEDGRSAWLVSVAGGRLYEWTSQRDGAIISASLETTSKGRKLAIIAFGNYDERPNLAGKLCAFDISEDRENPVWKRTVLDSELPPGIDENDLPRRKFNLAGAWIVDVFPDSVEGTEREIVAVFANSFSQRAIRVYSLQGELLYQVWHEGSVASCHWMSDVGLLVFAGDNGQGHVGQRAWVVFAIRPRRGVVESGYIRKMHAEESHEPLNPAWYRQLYPDDAYNRTTLVVTKPQSDEAGRSVYVLLYLRQDQQATVRWDLDSNGNRIPGSLVLNDHYRSHRAEYPDPNSFNLGPVKRAADGNGRPSSRPATDKTDNP